MRILVVDDDEQVRGFVSRALSSEGFDCETAADGSEALARIRTDSYDIILLDVLMPETDGVQVLNEMRDISSGAEMPVIAMSGGDAALPGWYAGNLMEMLGVEAVLYKPFSIEELLSQIRSRAPIQ